MERRHVPRISWKRKSFIPGKFNQNILKWKGLYHFQYKFVDLLGFNLSFQVNQWLTWLETAEDEESEEEAD